MNQPEDFEMSSVERKRDVWRSGSILQEAAEDALSSCRIHEQPLTDTNDTLTPSQCTVSVS